MTVMLAWNLSLSKHSKGWLRSREVEAWRVTAGTCGGVGIIILASQKLMQLPHTLVFALVRCEADGPEQ